MTVGAIANPAGTIWNDANARVTASVHFGIDPAWTNPNASLYHIKFSQGVVQSPP